MASTNKNLIQSLRSAHDPHFKLEGRVEGLEKNIPIQIAELHKTLSKSFGMQRKTLARVLGLESRLSNLEVAIEVWTSREASRRQQEAEQKIEEVAEEVADAVEDVVDQAGDQAEDTIDEEIPEQLDNVLDDIRGEEEIGSDDAAEITPPTSTTTKPKPKPKRKRLRIRKTKISGEDLKKGSSQETVEQKKISSEDLKKGSSQESIEKIESRVSDNEKKIELVKSILKSQMSDLAEKLRSLEPESEPESESESESEQKQISSPLLESLQAIAATTESIRDTLIQKQDNDKDILEDIRVDQEKADADKQEKGLENTKPKPLAKLGEKIAAPVVGLFGKIFNFIKTLFLGKFLMNFLDWFGNPENQGKIQSLIKFVGDYWPALTAAVLLFGTGFGGLVSGLLTSLAAFIPKMIAAVATMNPLLAIGLGTAAVVGGTALYMNNKKKNKEDENQQEEPQKFNKGGKFGFLNVPFSEFMLSAYTPNKLIERLSSLAQQTSTIIPDRIKLQNKQLADIMRAYGRGEDVTYNDFREPFEKLFSEFKGMADTRRGDFDTIARSIGGLDELFSALRYVDAKLKYKEVFDRLGEVRYDLNPLKNKLGKIYDEKVIAPNVDAKGKTTFTVVEGQASENYHLKRIIAELRNLGDPDGKLDIFQSRKAKDAFIQENKDFLPKNFTADNIDTPAEILHTYAIVLGKLAYGRFAKKELAGERRIAMDLRNTLLDTIVNPQSLIRPNKTFKTVEEFDAEIAKIKPLMDSANKFYKDTLKIRGITDNQISAMDRLRNALEINEDPGEILNEMIGAYGVAMKRGKITTLQRVKEMGEYVEKEGPRLVEEAKNFNIKTDMFKPDGTGVTKAFARHAYKGLLPEATRTRITKKGWNAPAHQWFSNQGRKKLLDLISSRQFIERGIYNQKELQNVVDEHFKILESGKNIENHMMVIWQIVSLEIWLKNIGSV